jgi:hypothetical protein
MLPLIRTREVITAFLADREINVKWPVSIFTASNILMFHKSYRHPSTTDQL